MAAYLLLLGSMHAMVSEEFEKFQPQNLLVLAYSLSALSISL